MPYCLAMLAVNCLEFLSWVLMMKLTGDNIRMVRSTYVNLEGHWHEAGKCFSAQRMAARLNAFEMRMGR